MKIAIIADSHINGWRKSNSFFFYIEKAFDFFIEECEARDVEYIFVAGDTFHSKNEVAAEMLLHINSIIDKLRSKNRKVFLITGNHDTFKKLDIEKNLLDIYKYFDGIKVVNTYEYIEINDTIIHMLPYYSGNVLIEKLNEINCFENKKNILISPFGVNGFSLLQSELVDIHSYHETVSPKFLKKFNWVYLGHFHGHQTRGNITYVSSPFQSRHGDEFGKHGFIFVDIDDHKFEFIENKYSPQYETIILSKNNLKEILIKENMFLRLVVQEFINKDILHKIFKKLKNQNNTIKISSDFNKTLTIDKLATIDGWEEIVYETPEDIIVGFIKKISDEDIPNNITKEELLEAMFND